MTPLYLGNGVQPKHSPQSYTLIQPLAGAKAYEAALGLQRAQTTTPEDNRGYAVVYAGPRAVC